MDMDITDFGTQIYNEAFALGEKYGLKQDRKGINDIINSLKETMQDTEFYKVMTEEIIIEGLEVESDREVKIDIINNLLNLMENGYISGFDKGFKEARQKARR